MRVEKGATFKRDGYGKKKQLSDSWRKPRGQHNKQREQKKAKGALPKPGFGSPIAVRGMHPSGFFEVLVSSVKELEGIDPKTHAIRIGATVGDRTRAGLQEKALAAGFKVLNARTVKTGSEQEKASKPAKVADNKKSEEKKPAKSKAPAATCQKRYQEDKENTRGRREKGSGKRKETGKTESGTSRKNTGKNEGSSSSKNNQENCEAKDGCFC